MPMPYHIISGEKCLELLFDVSGDKIMMKDFINASEEEIKGNFDEKAKVMVGF